MHFLKIIFFVLTIFIINATAYAEWKIPYDENTIVRIKTKTLCEAGKDESRGQGFFIDKTGVILTNDHNLESKICTQDKILRITVYVDFNKEMEKAKILGRDETTDLALIKIQAHPNIIPAIFGDSDKMKLRDEVFAIGNPFGLLPQTITRGIISGLHRRNLTSIDLADFLQTDAAINYGNSGGPLINSNGEVIGINARVITPAENLGFAIPINIVKRYVEALKKGDIKPVKTGIIFPPEEISPNTNNKGLHKLYELLDINETEILIKINKILLEKGGALVIAVEKNSPAEKIGLGAGDVIQNINGKKINNIFEAKVAFHDIGIADSNDKISIKGIHLQKESPLKIMEKAWVLKIIRNP